MNEVIVSTNRRGFEGQATQDDFEIPRAKLFHGVPTEYEEFPNAKPGQILNSITKEPLPHVFIPIIRSIGWIRFNPRDAKAPGFDANHAPGAVIWQSNNPADPRVIKEGAFGPDGAAPLATKFLTFLSYFPGVSMPILVSFSKTSLKTGKKLNTILSFNTGDMWESKFSIGSSLTKSGMNAYYVYEVNPAGKSSAEESAICANFYETFHKKQIDQTPDFE